MTTTTPPVVTTTCGDVQGMWNTPTSAAFLGIPFAEPPVGELRFAAPEPRAPWEGVRQATEYGPTPQRRQLMDMTAIPEPSIPGDDTLLVNVFTPAPGDKEAKLPVYVWIHGGGYTAGSPASPWYDGRAFNRDGIVTVTVSYRLGFVGFGHVDGAPENRGVLDWLLALQWVQDNIAQFGGDPGCVTIGGQSAGGGAVLTLLACRAAQGLFHRVISHSGAPADISLDTAIETGRKLAAALGVEPTAAALADVPEDKILDAQDEIAKMPDGGNPADMLGGMIKGEPGLLGFGPVIDGELIEGKVGDQFAAGVGADKALLMGSTANEFNMITAQAPKAANLIPAATILHKAGLPKDAAKAYVAAQPHSKSMEVVGQFLTDLMFHATIARTSTVHPAWVFEFAWPSPAAGGSSPHCLDLPFAWDCLDAEHVEFNTGPNPPQEIADAMHAAWVSFIKTGEPGWPVYGEPAYQAMVFNTPSELKDGVYGPVRALLPYLG